VRPYLHLAIMVHAGPCTWLRRTTLCDVHGSVRRAVQYDYMYFERRWCGGDRGATVTCCRGKPITFTAATRWRERADEGAFVGVTG